MSGSIIVGDMRERLAEMDAESIDACVTDPPYDLTAGKKGGTGTKSGNPATPYGRARISAGNGPGGFMGARWDATGIAFDPETWVAVMRVLKPGAHLLAFGGTRTFHRMTVAIEDAGFEIRDCLSWNYGSGFPKNHNIGKHIDRMAGIEREDKFEGAFERRSGPTGNKRCDVCGKWLVSGSPCQCPRPQDDPVSDDAKRWDGWGTALKPAWEPIILARKPFTGTIAGNVLRHGTGAINIDACRIDLDGDYKSKPNGRPSLTDLGDNYDPSLANKADTLGRWPANLLLDEAAAALLDAQSGDRPAGSPKTGEEPHARAFSGSVYGDAAKEGRPWEGFQDTGGASRFFYTAKASASERGVGNFHPTVKPLALMQWLVRLVTPPGGTVLDPFAGSCTTCVAADREGFNYYGIDQSADYIAIGERRLRDDAPMFNAVEVVPAGNGFAQAALIPEEGENARG